MTGGHGRDIAGLGAGESIIQTHGIMPRRRAVANAAVELDDV
jgi:hypothetical protein